MVMNYLSYFMSQVGEEDYYTIEFCRILKNNKIINSGRRIYMNMLW